MTIAAKHSCKVGQIRAASTAVTGWRVRKEVPRSSLASWTT